MSVETVGQNRKRAEKIIEILRRTYPDARVTLDYSTPFELLVAAILAAQCTDEKVNQITPALFRRYPSPQAFGEADQVELQAMVRPTGFFRQKARSIIEVAQDVVGRFGGEVPNSLEELTELRGVGRKTANLILGEVFGKQAIVVDTHVRRVTARLGLTDKKDPTKIEFDLMEVLPEEYWTEFNHLIIFHGRAICKAPTPLCERCPVLELCPFGRERMRLGPLPAQ